MIHNKSSNTEQINMLNQYSLTWGDLNSTRLTLLLVPTTNLGCLKIFHLDQSESEDSVRLDVFFIFHIVS